MKNLIYIKEPCNQHWEKMSAEEQGRHCAVCNKIVIDFTKLKNEEIIFNIQHSTKDVCGRININQLTAVSKQQKNYFWIKKTLFPQIKYATFIIFGFISFFKKEVFSQTLPTTIVSGETNNKNQSIQKKKLNIIVVNELNTPVSNAIINITMGIGLPIIKTGKTDKDGKFSADIEVEFNNEVFINLQVIAPDYITKEINNIRLVKSAQTINVKLNENIIMMGKMKHE